jgi:hypothetical protein
MPTLDELTGYRFNLALPWWRAVVLKRNRISRYERTGCLRFSSAPTTTEYQTRRESCGR